MKARKTTNHSKRSLGFLRASLMGGALATGHWASAQTIGYDLTTGGTVLSANGALVFTGAGANISGSAGTGAFNTFLTINSPTLAIVSGISTGGATGLNTQSAVGKTYGDFEVFTINAANYIGIALDINEIGGGSSGYLSLDSIVLYASSTSNADGSTVNNFLSTSGLTKVWSLDTLAALDPSGVSQDRALLMDAGLSPGSGGQSDIYLMVPESDFISASVSSTDSIYLYASFGGVGTVNGNNFANSWFRRVWGHR